MFKLGILIIGFALASCRSNQNTTVINNTKVKDLLSTTSNSNSRYFKKVFKEITFDTYIYGSNTTQAGKTVDLKLDVYQPKGDNLTKRPLIIFIHGGGFVMNNKSTIKSLGFLQSLAKSGFVVASIDYRLIDVPQNASTIPIAILNACEDTRAAIRYFRKDSQKNNIFRIDTNKIILGGYSAGAITALFTSFLNSQEKVDLYLASFSTYVKNNGGIEGNSGNEGYSSNVKGLFNIAGGINNIELLDNSVEFIYNLHGTNDTTVAIGDSSQLQGSLVVHQKAQELNINSQLNSPAVGHDILYTCADCRKAIQLFLAQQISNSH